MPSGINQKKAKRSSRDKGYYEAQRLKTNRNKVRRMLKRKHKAEKWARIKAEKQVQ